MPHRERAASPPLALLVLLFTALPAVPARAGNPVRPRTPVVHLDEACLVTLDRAVTPTAALAYTIPYEDTCDLPHAAPTHQFFALCRALAPGESLPQWLSDLDLHAALTTGVLLPPVVPVDIVAFNPEWSGCITRIAAPRAIDCEAAREPVLWDLHDMSPGTYAVAAYTFHPPANLWTPRRGLFRIVDSAAGELPPAAAFANRETFVYEGEALDLEVCVGAEPGATADLAYALHAAPDTWFPIAADLPIAGDRLHVPWDPPPELAATELHLRVYIRDLSGRTATAVAPELVHILAVPGESVEPSIPDPAPDICRPPGQELPAVDCEDRSGTDGQVHEDMSIKTSCNLAVASPPPLLALLLLVRRRRAPARRHLAK
ncbi:hypothetical protein [Nannocystis sp. SCPEA4]|uniref:hypothetical protein n=1 Tax=Nannocystis sp. SCPEA4 TaxID=2996787 RepID=UPI00226DCB65|nr:hypothetical protein [Nannocystis sp. SCPEA4]MCY1053526.1 hypothetical protein [Nannocystis sp. SCPEA4]